VKKIKLYLDNCCFNRPYDDQEHIKIKIESEAKIYIQEKIKEGVFDLCWSYILDFENDKNPQKERRLEIVKWKRIAKFDIEEHDELLNTMNELILSGLKPLDALHISCAIDGECNYFLTVDRGILKKSYVTKKILIMSPIDFINEAEELSNDKHRN